MSIIYEFDNPKYLSVDSPKVTFDGHEFSTSMGLSAVAVYVAALARRGDPLAIEFLTAFRAKVFAEGSILYWPPPDADVAARPTVIEVPRDDVVIGKHGEAYWKEGSDR